MEVNQWFDRSLNAMDKMAQANVDFLWLSMTKSEWAAWVQAVFSVIAILAAILIARFQYKAAMNLQIQEKVEKRNAELEYNIRMLKACLFAVDDVIDALDAVHARIKGSIKEGPDQIRAHVDGLLRTLNSLVTANMPPIGIEVILEMAREISYTRRAIADAGSGNKGDNNVYTIAAEERIKKIKEARKKIEFELDKLNNLMLGAAT